ncbi:DUF1289 domain-containing protein [Leptospira perolatii]|uniref:DUF1289 domain-containing protein n=1 Tax=Leptospira perolatii TaxID=2023191 RepID=UPI0013FE27E7|nr:DUF1289 domain-containing protein [Leptospira perolatii]
MVRSPCTKLCRLDPESGFCEGCYRTLQEIAMWTAFSEEERKRIRAELIVRKEKISGTISSEKTS